MTRVLACCDEEYFLSHAPAFVNSALSVGFYPHIHVINPRKTETFQLLNRIPSKSTEESLDTSKEYYAGRRFTLAPEMIGDTGILISDIDAIFNKHFFPPEQDAGIFLREQELFPGMKVAAGLVWYNSSDNGRRFANRVVELINLTPKKWYYDQIALYRTYLDSLEDPTVSVFRFTRHHLDWSFSDDTAIWTGKGNRKYKNKKYLEKKAYYESLNITS